LGKEDDMGGARRMIWVGHTSHAEEKKCINGFDRAPERKRPLCSPCIEEV